MLKLVVCIVAAVLGYLPLQARGPASERDGGALWIADNNGQSAPEAPPVWLGVRLTDVPEPLQAHLGRQGLMVANVVVDAPADRAGFERYDVLVSFNGRPIERMQELLDAIAGAGTDKSVPVEVIRGGKSLTLHVTPAARPAEGTYEHKYEEPEPEADASTSFFGGRLRPGGDGAWLVEPLGKLHRLPAPLDDLQTLDDEHLRKFFEELKSSPSPPMLHMRNWLDLNQLGPLGVDPADPDVQVHLKIVKKTDEGALEIETRADGGVEVSRTDASGNRTTTVYGSADELKDKDAEAYELYSTHRGTASFRFFVEPPARQDLPGLQQDFQIEIRRELERARELLNEAMDKVRAGRRPRTEPPADVRSSSRSISIEQNASGVHISIDEDGQRSEYRFESVEELQKEKPELYEQLKELLKPLENSRADEPEELVRLIG